LIRPWHFPADGGIQETVAVTHRQGSACDAGRIWHCRPIVLFLGHSNHGHNKRLNLASVVKALGYTTPELLARPADNSVLLNRADARTSPESELSEHFSEHVTAEGEKLLDIVRAELGEVVGPNEIGKPKLVGKRKRGSLPKTGTTPSIQLICIEVRTEEIALLRTITVAGSENLDLPPTQRRCVSPSILGLSQPALIPGVAVGERSYSIGKLADHLGGVVSQKLAWIHLREVREVGLLTRVAVQGSTSAPVADIQ
jgi:hypothetical protein